MYQQIGHQIGSQVKDLLAEWIKLDQEMPRLRSWVKASKANQKIFENFVEDTRAAFPNYMREME